MNKIYVEAFLAHNLGDDLFLQILSNRYKDNAFITLAYDKYDNFSNIKIYGGKFISLINKAIKLITCKKKNLNLILSQRSKINIVIGGSMFMETVEMKNYNNFKKYINEKIKCKNTYILGANFGPYKNLEYKNEYEKYFSKVNDVCFRDNYSFQLFNKLKNVRIAPDIVFSLNTTKFNITNRKRVVVSVIDLESNPKLSKFETVYKKNINALIKFFYNKDYEIILMSFCKNDKDEIMVNKIANECIDIPVSKYFYNGNIDEALSIIADSQIVIGSRFHANILGMIFNKTIIPIAYSDKTINVLKDLNFKGTILDIRKMDNYELNCDSINLSYKIDVNMQKKNALNHFSELDKILVGDKNE